VGGEASSYGKKKKKEKETLVVTKVATTQERERQPFRLRLDNKKGGERTEFLEKERERCGERRLTSQAVGLATRIFKRDEFASSFLHRGTEKKKISRGRGG